MTAGSMEERTQKLAALAQKQADEDDRPIEAVVHKMAHELYLRKHTTEDVLSELGELQALYPDAFYNGAANDHLMEYLEDSPDFEFWYDTVYLALAAGLEWAVLQEVEKSLTNPDSAQ